MGGGFLLRPLSGMPAPTPGSLEPSLPPYHNLSFSLSLSLAHGLSLSLSAPSNVGSLNPHSATQQLGHLSLKLFIWKVRPAPPTSQREQVCGGQCLAASPHSPPSSSSSSPTSSPSPGQAESPPAPSPAWAHLLRRLLPSPSL